MRRGVSSVCLWVFLAFAVVLNIPTVCNGATIYWQGGEVCDRNGTAIDPSWSGWVLRMYESTLDTTVEFSNGNPMDDDVLRVEQDWNPADYGYFGNQVDNPSGIAQNDNVYSVLFSPDGYYCILDGSELGGYTTAQVESMDPGWAYDTGANDYLNDWHPVPEPTSMILFGIGAVGFVVAGRRRRARSA